jgi:hypothetical protein
MTTILHKKKNDSWEAACETLCLGSYKPSTKYKKIEGTYIIESVA